MNLPQVYMYSPSWTLLPPPSPYHPSGSFQCTSPKHPVSCIEPGLVTRFIWYYTCFNAILPNHPTLSLSHRVQKTVLYISFNWLGCAEVVCNQHIMDIIRFPAWASHAYLKSKKAEGTPHHWPPCDSRTGLGRLCQYPHLKGFLLHHYFIAGGSVFKYWRYS